MKEIFYRGCFFAIFSIVVITDSLLYASSCNILTKRYLLTISDSFNSSEGVLLKEFFSTDWVNESGLFNTSNLNKQLLKDLEHLSDKFDASFNESFFARNENRELLNKLEEISSNNKEIVETTNVSVIKFELQQQMLTQLEKINAKLPEKIRIKAPKLNDSSRMEQAFSQGRNHIEKIKEKLNTILLSTPYKNIAGVNKFISEKGRDFKAIIDMLQNSKYDIAMRVPENLRWDIKSSGFHNTHETGTSGGFINSDRLKAEADGLSVSGRNYIAVSNDAKPKYGYIIPKKDTELSIYVKSNINQYGSDIYIFKDKIKESSTLTAGDSLANWLNFKNVSKNLRHYFIPFEFRTLLAAYLYVDRGVIKPSKSNSSLLPEFETDGFGSSAYIEAQIHQPLRLEDVSEFIYEENPPTGSFLKRLNELGIKISKK